MKTLLFLIATMLLFAAAGALQAQTYAIEDLGTLSATPSDGVRAAGINNRGHVHGENDKTNPSGTGVQWRSFLWDGAVLNEIFPLVLGSTWSGGLNDLDHCVGKYTAGSLSMHGYFWNGGPIVDVDVGNRNCTHIMDINADRNCTGTYLSDQVWGLVYRYHAFVMNSAGQWLDIGTLGGYESFAKALNDWNHAIGWTRDDQNHHLGYLWTYANGMIDIGNLGGTFCDPEDIDNFGRIVGASADASGNHRPFLRENGAMIDLGTLGGAAGRAKGINDFGVIVGNAGDAGGVKRAVIWESGAAVDLNTLIPAGTGWNLTGAGEINELGEITGTGLLNGVQRAYKLTPLLAAARISGFQPGFAGRTNTMFGLGFTPGANVEVYYGFAPGSTTLPCGATLDIANARLLAAATADPDGRIEFAMHIPTAAAGRVQLLQSVEPASCTVGELLAQPIQ